MNAARGRHFAVLLSDGRVLVGGGTTTGGGTTNSAEIYDPSTNSWTLVNPLTTARANASAALLQDGHVLVAGGDNDGVPSNTIEIFDPSTGNFMFAATLSSPRTQQGMAVLQDGRVLIVGGFDGSNALASSDLFDPSTGMVSAGPALATARYAASVTTMMNGQVAVIGGVSRDASGGTIDLASIEIFDPAAGVFTTSSVGLVSARDGHQAFLLPNNNNVLIVGGSSNGSAVTSSELFTAQVAPSNGVWSYSVSPTGSMNSARTGASGSANQRNGPTSAVNAKPGYLLLAGGSDGSGATLASTEIYGYPTIQTDQADYPPGTTVNITGSGFAPGETVAITLVESPLIDTHGPYTAIADANGNISDSSFATDAHDENVRFWLSAVGGQSGVGAQNTFTDAATNIVFATSGLPASTSISVSYSGTNNGGHAISGTATFSSPGPSSGGQGSVGTDPGSSFSYTFPSSVTVSGTTYNFVLGAPASPFSTQASGTETVTGTYAAACTAPSVTAQPASQSITYGLNATFIAAASGNPSPAVQWQVSTNSGNTWTNIAGATSTSLTLTTPPAGASGNQYRAVFTNTCNGTQTATSNAATLTVGRVTVTATVTASNKGYDGAAIATQNSCTLTGIVAGDDGNVTCSAGTLTFSDKNVGTGKTVNVSGISLSGSAAGNYTLSSTTAITTANITALHIMGTFTASNKVYDGTTAAIVATESPVGAISGDNLLLTGGTATFSDKNIGIGKAVTLSGAALTGTDAGNYVLDSVSTTKADITAVTLTTAIIGNPTKPYDGNTSAMLVPSNYALTGLVSGESITVTQTAGAYNSKDVATATTVTASLTAANFTAGTGTLLSNYVLPTSGSGPGHITKADASISVTAYTVTYDGNPHTATGSATGVAGEALAVLDLSGTTHTNAGDYTDTWTFTDVTGNYNTASSTVKDCIKKANATITVTSYAVTYDGSSHTATGSATGVKGESLAGLDLTHTTHTGASTYSSDYWSFTDSTGNYNSVGNTTITDAISKADAKITVTPYSVTYDGHAHTATITSITGVNGEIGATVGTVDVSNTTHTNSGTYASDSWNFTGTANYNPIAPTTISDTINRADAKITVTPYSLTYDGNAHTAVGIALGVESTPADLSALLHFGGTTHTNAGDYTDDSWSFDGNGNYNSTNGKMQDRIDRANAVVSLTGYDVTYDGNAHTATGTATGVNSEALSGLDLSGTTHSNAGTYNDDVWTFTDVTGNYNNMSGSVKDCIKKANAFVRVMAYNVTYDGNSHMATGSATGVKGEDLSGLDLSGTMHTPAGPYASDPWTFSDSTGNYNNASGAVSDSIARANVTVNVTPYSVIYDGNSHSATGSATGVKGESLAGLELSGTTHSKAGTYTADGWTFTDVTGNYNNTSGSVEDCIRKANAIVSVTPYNVTYDGNPHTATGSATGVKGEALSGLDLSGTTHTTAGTYGTDPWTFTDSTGNYDNSNGNVGDSIAKANATIVATPYSLTYDGSSHTAAGTATGVKGEPLNGFDLSGTTHTYAGSYTDHWTFTDGTGNYNNATGTVSDSIAKANALITVTPYVVTYDGNAHSAIGSVKGVLNESLAGLSLSGTTHTNPGDYSSDAWTFTDATGNYNPATGTVHDSIKFNTVCVAGLGDAILPPINNDGSSVYKRQGGSTIPVKFRVCDALGNAISNAPLVFASGTGSITMLNSARGTVDNVNETTLNDIADVAFRWDSSGQQWLFNMATTNLASGNTYQFRINLLNSSQSITFGVGVK
jgi:hypothetical protein